MITIYSRPGCSKCDITKLALTAAGLPYEERSLLDPAAEAEAMATRFRTLPIVVDGDVTWCDMRPDLIAEAAARAAEPVPAGAA